MNPGTTTPSLHHAPTCRARVGDPAPRRPAIPRRSPLLGAAARIIALALLALLLAAAPGRAKPHQAGRAGAGDGPRVVISLERQTLRLERGGKGGRVVFPVGLGRWTAAEIRGPRGTLFTGPDPTDRRFYLPKRNEPAFHRGLPFLRLDAPIKTPHGPGRRSLWGIHGPVTPTLVWGRVSAGCVRLQPEALAEVYRVALRHPRMPVTFLRGPDRVGGKLMRPTPRGAAPRTCPEAALGVRRLRRIRPGEPHRHRVCGGVDHWFALELSGGDLVNVRLEHRGKLRVELYGIRAISSVARGKHGFAYRVPAVHNNRGDRLVRVVAPPGQIWPYTLTVSLAGPAR